MTNKPAVSVVVPLYNKRAYLGRCLDSIRRQACADFEVIVVDDGSTDGGGTIALQFGDRRFRVVAQKNRGAGAARNRGIAESRADLVAFVDADDEWHPLFLQAILGLAAQYPSAGLLATGFRRCDGLAFDKEVTLAQRNGGRTRLITDYLRRVPAGDFVTASSSAVPKAVLADVGSFLEGEPIGEDVEMWARIALNYPIAYDTRILAEYHVDATERSFDRWRVNPPYPPVVRSLRQALAKSKLPAATIQDARAYIDWRLLNYAYWLLDLRRGAVLRRLLREEQFSTGRFRIEAQLLRLALRILPFRVIRALKWRPLRILSWIRCRGVWGRGLNPKVRRDPVAVVTRLVPALHIPVSQRQRR